MENPGAANFADTETGTVSANEAGTEGGTTTARRCQRLARLDSRTALITPARP